MASISESIAKRRPFERLLGARRIRRIAVPLPAWLLWGVAATLSLAWGTAALGIAVALSETTPAWWIVLPFGMAPAIAVLFSADRVIKLTARPSEAQDSAESHQNNLGPVPDARPEVLQANGTGRAVLVDDLTEREREVLALLATGRTNSEIAGALFVATGTIKSHVNAVCRKLGARNRTEAVARARALSLLKDG